MPDSTSLNPDPRPEPLALCGIGCRFPGGVRDVESFWELLTEGRSAITEVPADRWDAGRYFHLEPDASGKMITRWGGFVDQLKEFDAGFWGISPREASRMDPQQRWLLETAWEALEDAGIPPSTLRGSDTGVFIGISSNDYGSLQLSDYPRIDVHTNSGGTMSIAANRISYQFDFKGPSIAIDTACSSALVAVSQACQAIWHGECEAALAGGVNALITPHSSVGFSKANMLSPSGKCFAFDARADGYVRGEGAGLVFLKPLPEAIDAGDRIYAVIRAAVVNQDGHTSTMTVPAVGSQTEMLRQAYAGAGIPPRRVSFVEAHGTGTPVGDPIEALALGTVIGEGRAGGEACLIGSVKTNLGHLESASGAAGLIKTAMVLERGTVPASLNFKTPNPQIPFDELGLKVSAESQSLPCRNGDPPVAAVNSFGFGGTNAHVVLEGVVLPDSKDRRSHERAERPFALPISARDEFSLRESAKAYRIRLENSSADLADLCYSAGARKEHHGERLVILGNDSGQLQDRLGDWIHDQESARGIIAGSKKSQAGQIVFVYTGQGPQWWGMGRLLLDREPVFRRAVEQIDALLKPLAGWSLIDEMGRPEDESRINLTSIAQPAIFALQVALTDLWKSWGIAPAFVVGHSVGEVAAACCAGIHSLADAVRIVFERSRLQETTGGRGRMLAAGIPAAEARRLIGKRADQIKLSAINSPDLVTLAGDTAPIEEFARELEAQGRFVRWLPVDYAFHTHQMEPIREELLGGLAEIRPGPGDIPFFSTVTGDVISGEKLDADYWWKNVRHPVLFGPAIARLSGNEGPFFVEIGPHPSLRSSLEDGPAGPGGSGGGIFHSLRRNADESEEILSQLAGLHLAGVPVDWAAVNQSPGRLVRLPHYPWHYQTHWLDEGEMASRLLPEPHPLLGNRISAAKPTWQCDLDPDRFQYLRDHRVWNSMVFPAAGYGELGLALARELFPGAPYVVEKLESLKALFIPESGFRTIQIVFDPADRSYGIFSMVRGDNEWELNARGRLVLLSKEPAELESVDLDELRQRMTRRTGHEQFYAEFHAIGYQFGPDFCLIENACQAEGEALVEIPVPEGIRETREAYRFHPAILDACFQAARGLRGMPPGANPDDYFFLPESVRRIQIHTDQIPTRVWAHAIEAGGDKNSIAADLFIYDDAGHEIARILGFRAARVGHNRAAEGIDQTLYQFKWVASAFNDDDDAAEPESESPLPFRGNHLVLSNRGAIADALSKRIEAAGGTAICFHSEPDLEHILSALDENGLLPVSIVHCRSLDLPESSHLDFESLRDSLGDGVQSVLQLCHALQGSEWEIPPRVFFVTRGAQPVKDGDATPGIASAPLSGIARVANNEHPENRWTTIDLEPAPPRIEAGKIFDEIAADSDDLEVAHRDGIRFVHELSRLSLDDLPKRRHSAAGAVPFRLETGKAGVLSNLSLNETQRREPGPDEVEVFVKAGGVNFRDVMKALGIYPGNPADLRWFGDDFAGTVLRVGENVDGFQTGDRVAGIAPYCFRSHATADHRLVFKLPPDMSFEAAATLPTVFLTAQYALDRLARLQSGEKVLIHAGSGGVGQAAIQIAQHLGLEIFATAGSPEKRRALSDMGVPHVLNSRTLEFADEILRITGGEGVDAVLNSLAGPFIPKSLSVLAPFGRFLEIGKADIYGRSKIGMESLKDNISYHVIDLAQQLARRPEQVAALFADLSAKFAIGAYRPLPRTVFPVSQSADAFRFMAQGKHIGKVVLSFEADRPIEIGPSTGEGRLFRRDATYVISGGASGFGWATAKWMAEQGAGNLALLSRSGSGETVSGEIGELRSGGVRILDLRCDVTEPASLASAIDRIRDELPPIKGVVHAAMVLDDDLIANLDELRFGRAMNPKILGAWNLHDATRSLPLEHFICFSSISAIAGGPKQSNYNAGNAFLDTLAHHRRSLGLPALSINWGALRGTGFVERNQKTADYLEKIGLEAFRVDEALRILRALILRDPGSIAAARVDWQKLGRFLPLIAGSRAYSLVTREKSDDLGRHSILSRILSIPEGGRNEILEDFMAEKVAGVLGVERDLVDRATPITSLGLDSLMAVELINGLESDLGMKVPMGNLMSGPSVMELSRVILTMLGNLGEVGESDLFPGGRLQGSPSIDTETRRLEFWMSELEGVPAGIQWPASVNSGKGGRGKQNFQLDHELARRLILLSAEQGVPPETTLLAAFEVFLHTVTLESELLIAFSTGGDDSGPIPLRSRAGGDPYFYDFLAQTHTGKTTAGRVPIPPPAVLTDALVSPKETAGWPLHRVEFELGAEPAALAAPADLKLTAAIADGAIAGNWMGDSGWFDDATLDRFHEIFIGTLQRIVRNPDEPISKLVPVSDEERAAAEAGKSGEPRPVIRFRKNTASLRADFLADAELDPSIQPGNDLDAFPSPPSRVFLTGATGFLGGFLLDELLKRTEADIHCLIRARSETEAMERLRSNLGSYGFDPRGFDRRVNPVIGDLAQPLIGLTEERFAALAGEIDAIYHNGAGVNLVLPYEALRPPNVEGTREILRLACYDGRAIPTHVVSTFTVQTTTGNRGVEVTEEDPLPACESLLYGYSQSKWVAEKMIEEARLRGLPVSIYRPGHITGDSRTGASNTGDLLHTMLLVCWRLGMAPLRDAEFDVTPVNYVARAIVELSLQKDALGKTFLLTNPRPLQTREFAEWIDRLGLGVEAVSYERWRQRLLEIVGQSQSDEIRPLVEILAPRALADDAATAVHPRFNCDRSVKFLAKAGISCPPADTELFSTYLGYLQEKRERSVPPIAKAHS